MANMLIYVQYMCILISVFTEVNKKKKTFGKKGRRATHLKEQTSMAT